jgi:predicted MPP superfamily phosphohydrolase
MGLCESLGSDGARGGEESVNLHARGWKRFLFESAFWILVAFCFGLCALGLWLRWIPLLVIGLIGFGILIYGGFIEPRLVRVAQYSLGEGEKRLRLVFLSDFHAGVKKQRAFYQRIAERVSALEPDLLMLGGDFVDECAEDIGMLAPILDLRPPLGTRFVLGNHDFFDDPKKVIAQLVKAGARDLTNQSVAFKLTDTESLELVGLDDSLHGSPDLRLAEKPKQGMRIIVMHEPDLLLDLPEGCADLVLLGHTHGGQIRLPIYGPVVGLPQVISQTLDAGERSWKGLRVIISRGIGEALVRARLGVRPEIVVLDVKK